MDILSRIVDTKNEEIGAAASRRPLPELKAMCRDLPSPRPFFQALAQPGPSGVNIISEIKRKSPSKGILKPDLNPTAQAAAYAKGGATALSVLTDAHYFGGSPVDLSSAREAVSLPVLRKDFLITEYQIFESRVMGADAVLLICRILTEPQCRDLLALSRELRMGALVEVHTPEDLDMAIDVGARLIGINNRNLASFDTDIRTAARLCSRLKSGQIPVAASGIRSRADIELNLSVGIFNFLIGESLVRSEDPVRMLKELQHSEPSDRKGLEPGGSP